MGAELEEEVGALQAHFCGEDPAGGGGLNKGKYCSIQRFIEKRNSFIAGLV